ncbi:acyl-CoA dehydrogenase family protein [Mycolicibacterium thermoresistibile]|uniref:Acyl-CoA dehydrogenase domain-containing protein n=2 Tax=Mycolicibacterium thermoresistibile TaxID=1797 RepID=G7CH31_MYCT3|nr:acyl-CoA dehydrogenase family protein [Mycolicibacterium thermoresistibile]EHI12141.1 acyl-CoA dehydrogenase domain-containing protein [Mycolicibacterium thermoresistibile ATCC 19527]MCV7191144.1 acyl-CoA dehydrogenase family protein [Mycolicibacterium thermoresistibile]GAT15508.1 acyl-CoA dehydrogenase domain-containing protein [Mycolicibacterium thermoresistibile]SNW16941.1 acyl-CoA dehydrogenase domain-containing protein [Mycolicibacterium thermoresistibile]
MWDFATEPEVERELEWIREFVKEEIEPLETLDLDDAAMTRAMEPLKQQVKDRGLWAAHLPPELGGQGFGQVRLALMHEILGRSHLAPIVFGNQAPDSGNAELLAVAGTPEQKRRWLDPLLAGTIRSCYAMTEPGAGADPTMLTTTARLAGDEWILNGRKWFASNASIADLFIVMAVTDPEAARHQRASMFLVPAGTPGLVVERDIPTMEHPYPRPPVYGNHAEVSLTDVRVPAENLLGERGRGFALAQTRLGPGRIHHCMRWLGQSERALEMLCERAVSRTIHGSLLSEKQMIQDWVAESVAERQAARLMTLHAAWKIDTEGVRGALTEIAMIKYWGARVLYNVIDRAIQLHGSLGYSCDMPLEFMYRQARAARLYDGPDEVHKVTVARRTLREFEPREVPSEHIPTRRAAAREKFAHLLAETAANS